MKTIETTFAKNDIVTYLGKTYIVTGVYLTLQLRLIGKRGRPLRGFNNVVLLGTKSLSYVSAA